MQEHSCRASFAAISGGIVGGVTSTPVVAAKIAAIDKKLSDLVGTRITKLWDNLFGGSRPTITTETNPTSNGGGFVGPPDSRNIKYGTGYGDDIQWQGTDRFDGSGFHEDGSFSIWNWEGYPSSIPKPKGPFKLLEGQEYIDARHAASQANRAISRDWGLRGKEVDIHEIIPVKFGGSPTNLNNKLILDRSFHQQQVSPFWYKIQTFNSKHKW